MCKQSIKLLININVKKEAVSGGRQSQICISQVFNFRITYRSVCTQILRWCSPDLVAKHCHLSSASSLSNSFKHSSYQTCTRSILVTDRERDQTSRHQLLLPFAGNCFFLDTITDIPLACLALHLHPRLCLSQPIGISITAKNSNIAIS